MFSKAVPIAAGFTQPVVISSRTTQGACAGTIGAYVVANRAGAPESASSVRSGLHVLVRSRLSSSRIVGFSIPGLGGSGMGSGWDEGEDSR